MIRRFAVMANIAGDDQLLERAVEGVADQRIEKLYMIGNIVSDKGSNNIAALKTARDVASRVCKGPADNEKLVYADAELVRWYENLPESFETQDMVFAHGSPYDHFDHTMWPDSWFQGSFEDGTGDDEGELDLGLFSAGIGTRLVFVSRGHLPMLACEREGKWMWTSPNAGDNILVSKKDRYVINPGSVRSGMWLELNELPESWQLIWHKA